MGRRCDWNAPQVESNEGDRQSATQFRQGLASLTALLHLSRPAEGRAGAVSIEDAVARIKAKAGGELIAAEGVLETAIERAAWFAGWAAADQCRHKYELTVNSPADNLRPKD